MNSAEDYIIEGIIEQSLKNTNLHLKPKFKQFVVDTLLEEINKVLAHPQFIVEQNLSIEKIANEIVKNTFEVFSHISKIELEKENTAYIFTKVAKYTSETMVICLESSFDERERKDTILEEAYTSARIAVASLKDNDKISEEIYSALISLLEK